MNQGDCTVHHGRGRSSSSERVEEFVAVTSAEGPKVPKLRSWTNGSDESAVLMEKLNASYEPILKLNMNFMTEY
jgi:hypothetical protein